MPRATNSRFKGKQGIICLDDERMGPSTILHRLVSLEYSQDNTRALDLDPPVKACQPLQSADIA